MSIKIPKPSSTIKLEDGTYIARCYQIIHIGTTRYEWNGQTNTSNKVRITFEIPSEMRTFKEGEPEKPVVISGEWNLSFGKKSKLRPLLESWKGKAFKDLEIDEFEVGNLLGQPAVLSIVKNEKGYPEITGISKLMKGVECPPAINPPVILDYDNFNEDVFEKLPPFIKEKIKSSDEYRRMKGENINANGDEEQPEEPESADSIPF